jgi:hypothetical protein
MNGLQFTGRRKQAQSQKHDDDLGHKPGNGSFASFLPVALTVNGISYHATSPSRARAPSLALSGSCPSLFPFSASREPTGRDKRHFCQGSATSAVYPRR